ncbi:MAG TPA: hypothetical protein VHB72_03220 [Candidatus Saccharimonadales bacterium]|nr:hypothetical protein [Candidatus Saccharimonadales bacterium]
MTKELWEPSDLDKFQAHEAYFRYAVGVIMLNDPGSMSDLHQKNLADAEQQQAVLVHAKTLIWAGLSDVIRYANPPELRSPFTNTENNFAEAFPHMRDTVREVAEEESDRLSELNNTLPILRPLPLAHETVYKSIAHGRKEKVYVFHAMDVFPVSSSFNGDIENQTFKGVPRITMAHRDSARPPLRLAEET